MESPSDDDILECTITNFSVGERSSQSMATRSPDYEELITLELENPSSPTGKEVFLLVTDIYDWNLCSILSSRTVRNRAHRDRESSMNCISVHWDLESFITMLQFIYGRPLEFTITKFLSLLEGPNREVEKAATAWRSWRNSKFQQFFVLDCGKMTLDGMSSLMDCKAVEDLLLRHNGPGIPRNFIVDAASKLPLLRKLALDLCDARDGGFDRPSAAGRFFLSTVKIARCRSEKCAFLLPNMAGQKHTMHKESIIMEWNSEEHRTSIVEERV